MTTSRKDLKTFFENGKLPTGENFAELIDSMVHQSELAKHEEDFRKWTEHGKILLGAGDKRWALSVDQALHLQVRLEDDVAPESSPADVNLAGWTGMGGRLGTSIGDKDFSGEAAELDLSALRSVKSDGNWYQIVGAPERPCAFEITAAVSRPKAKAESEVWQFFARLIGNVKPDNAVVHAVAAANGVPGSRPHLRRTAQPNPRSGWRLLGHRLLALLLIALVVGLLLESPLLGDHQVASVSPTSAAGTVTPAPRVGVDIEKLGNPKSRISMWIEEKTGLKGLAASVSLYPYLWVAALILVLLYFLRMLLFAFRNQRNGIQLEWSRASGSRLTGSATYTLQIRGPAYEQGDADIHYHITKLWS